ncbi:MAG: alcohol dehydrogenase catalytic domain-containing protein [Anaerolineales bacterium]
MKIKMSPFAIPAVMQVPAFTGGGKISICEKPVPQPGAGELLIQVKANALCGSERWQFYDGTETTPGHETAGVVVATGSGTKTPVGTPGVIFLMDFCGTCRSCRLGFTQQCLAKRGDMGFNRDGGYSPYELVHENIFFPIDAGISLTEATLLLDIMGTSSHAIQRARLIRPDIESVVVTGAGPIGLGILAMLRILLGEDISVIIADFVDYRLKLIESLRGLPLDLKRYELQAGLRHHGLISVDAAFDTSGKAAARRACLNVLAQRGVLVCVGHGEGLDLTVSPDLIAPERAVLGSEYFRYDELPANLSYLRQNRAYLTQLITHRFPIRDVQEAFELFFSGNSGKVVVEQ